ncbi:MAG: hypothetical protein MJE68_04090, partial [Proteobacteria bacterium]|nr:hypothetical protein [Pseudomonadota bacterium]
MRYSNGNSMNHPIIGCESSPNYGHQIFDRCHVPDGKTLKGFRAAVIKKTGRKKPNTKEEAAQHRNHDTILVNVPFKNTIYETSTANYCAAYGPCSSASDDENRGLPVKGEDVRNVWPLQPSKAVNGQETEFESNSGHLGGE